MDERKRELANTLRALRPWGENRYAPAAAKHEAAGRLAQWAEMCRGLADYASDGDPAKR